MTLRIPGCSPARPPSVHRAKNDTHHTLLYRGVSLGHCASPQVPPRRLCAMSCAPYDGWGVPEVPAPNWAARQRDNSTRRPRSPIVTDRRKRTEPRGAPVLVRHERRRPTGPDVPQSGDGRELPSAPWMRTAGDISGWSAPDGGRRSIEGSRTMAAQTSRLGCMTSVHAGTTRSPRRRLGERRRERLRFGHNGTRPDWTASRATVVQEVENQDGSRMAQRLQDIERNAKELGIRHAQDLRAENPLDKWVGVWPQVFVGLGILVGQPGPNALQLGAGRLGESQC